MAHERTAPGGVLVLGIGNLLWADEGFGVRCVEALEEAWILPPEVRVVDGGTQGLYLLPHVQEAERLLVFDAIDWGLPPGTLEVVEGDAVPRFMGAKKMSLHQTGFQDVLAAAELTGRAPSELYLVGCQPEELEDYGGSLRPSVKARIPEALGLAVARLARWGFTAAPRVAGDRLAAAARVHDPALALAAYERA